MFKSNALLNFLFADDTTAKIKHEGVRYPCDVSTLQLENWILESTRRVNMKK